jgi:hypothetical protein
MLRFSGQLPSKLGRGLLWAAKAYLLPTSLKKLSAALAMSFVLHPLAGTIFFPRAQQYLQARGMNPEIADEISGGRNIRVMEKGTLSTLYIAAAHPSLPLMAYHAYLYSQLLSGAMFNTAALGTLHGEFDGLPLAPGLKNLLPAFVITNGEPDSISPEEFVSRFTYIPAAQAHSRLSQQENREMVLLHEFRHCALPNQEIDDPLMREGDAEFESLSRTAARHRNPVIIREGIYRRMAWDNRFDENHNIALYLDARFAGRKPPAPDAIINATQEAYDLISDPATGRVRLGDMEHGAQVIADAFRRLLAQPDVRISRLARRYAALYVESVHYFTGAPVRVSSLQTPDGPL